MYSFLENLNWTRAEKFSYEGLTFVDVELNGIWEGAFPENAIRLYPHEGSIWMRFQIKEA